MINSVLLYNSGGGIGDALQILPLIDTLKSEFKNTKFYYLSAHENLFNSTLKDFNIKIDTLIYEYNNDILENFIISQFPKAGKLIKSGDEITLVVSLGNPPNYYIAPNLINVNLIKAKKMISKAGLLLGNITYEYNENYLYNTVLEQSKTPGMRLSFPSKIDLIVSNDK